MIKRILIPTLAALIVRCQTVPAQTRTVMADADGRVLAPANIWEANPARSVGGPYNPEYVFAVVNSVPRGASTFVETNTEFDRVFTRSVFDPVVTDWVVAVEVLRDEFDNNLVFSTSDVTKATVDDQGRVTHVADGDFDLILTVGDYSRSFSLTNTTDPDAEINLLTGGVAGSLREALTRPIDDALEISTDTLMFSVRDHETSTYTRNVDFWGYEAAPAAAWSAIPVRWSGHPTINRGGTLIASDIFATAAHYPPNVGSQYTYAEADGTLHVRTVVALRHIANDLMIGRLDEPLPAGVPPMPVFPDFDDYRDKSEASTLFRVPIIGLDKFLHAHVRDFQAVAWSTTPELPDRIAAYRNVVGGDSSSPVMFTDGTDLIYLFGWWTNKGGTPAGHYVAEINAAILDMGSSAEITVYDVSAFPDFKFETPSF